MFWKLTENTTATKFFGIWVNIFTKKGFLLEKCNGTQEAQGPHCLTEQHLHGCNQIRLIYKILGQYKDGDIVFLNTKTKSIYPCVKH